MTPPSRREESLFLLALEKPPSERAAFLDQECAGDAALRFRLEALLAAHDEPETLQPNAAAVGPGRPSSDPLLTDPGASPGQVLGRYTLVEKLGEGGCGVVFVAEQTEPVRRQVALKILKPGMDTRAVLARFQAERQALALMDHPGIAKVLDAGTTETGRPYFVMEWVRGPRITEYCDGHNLGVEERLELFIKVCQAIQHAHQKGVIHRDIKPSNILVVEQDGVAVPKVIDFGIAKATEGRLTEATLQTQLHHVLGTPAYMSPEQAEMGALDIDTRSDVYSLGVLLYELLTGTTPFRTQELVAQGLDAMRRTIREQEPVRPSTRLAQRSDACPDAPAAPRPSALARDLDWIVMKCLEKDRARRYETANGLAADLRRHLVGEEVTACPPSAAYRFRKALVRHKLAFAVGAAIALVLTAGLGVSVWQWRTAEAARREAIRRAEAEAEARGNETRERENAQRAHARAADLLVELEIQRAGELFLTDRPSRGVVHLARVLRDHPAHAGVAAKLASALVQLNFAWPLAEFSHHHRLRFSPDGGRFLTVSNHLVQVWNTKTAAPDAPPFVHAEPVTVAEFSPDGGRVLTESGTNPTGSRHLRVWSVEEGRVGEVLIPVVGVARTPQFSADGQRILAVVEGSPRVWEARTGRLVFPPDPEEPDPARRQVVSVQWSPDARQIVGTSERAVYVWDFSTGRLVLERSDDVWGPASVNGRHRLSPAGDRWATYSQGTVRLWEVSSGRLTVVLPGSTVLRVEFSPDGQRIVTAAADRTVRIWDAGTGQPAGEALRHESDVVLAGFSRNGQWILTAGADGLAHVWDAISGRPLVDEWRLADRLDPLGYWATWSFSPDGRAVAMNYGNTLRLWELSMAPMATTRDAWSAHQRMRHPSETQNPNDSHFAAVPPPPWLPELAEVIAGHRLDDQRDLQVVPFNRRMEFHSQVSGLPAEGPYFHLARWLIGPVGRRTISPFSGKTIERHVQDLVVHGKIASLQEALRLSPVSGAAMARLAVQWAANHPFSLSRRATEADYLSQQAVDVAPGDPEVWRIRSEVLAAFGKLQDALAANERALRRFAGNPELWNQRGRLLELASSHAEAESAYSRAIALARESPDGQPEREAQFLWNRADARARLGKAIEAEADRLAGLRVSVGRPRSDSPQWGGRDPGRNLYAEATNLPSTLVHDPAQGLTEEEISAATQGIRFRVPLGSQSYESLAVVGGRIFVGTNNEHSHDPRHQGDRSILLCLDEESGMFLWQLVIPKLASGKVHDWEHLGLLSTPAVEGNRLYLVTTRNEVLCLTTDGLAKGNIGPFRDEKGYMSVPGQPEVEPGPRDADIVWRYDMMQELGVFPHNGSRTHVLLVGDLLYVGTCNAKDWTHANIPSPRSPSLIALNKHTGELVGEDDADIGPRILHGQWSSPSTGRVGDRQLIFYGGGDGFCYAFDATPVPGPDGPVLKKVWWADCNPPEYRTRNGVPIRYPNAEGPSEILATPVFWKDRVYVAIGQDPEHGEGLGNLVCLDATQEGDITGSGILWSYRGIQRSMSTAAITPDGLLFIADFSGFIHCVDAGTGMAYWKHDMEAHIWGSTLVADGKVYVGDEDGDLVVLAATKEKKILSDPSLKLATPIYSTPVVARDVVYLNAHDYLFAFQDSSFAWDLARATNTLATP